MTREALSMIVKLQLAEIQHSLHADKRITYINGVPATEKDVADLEWALRNGYVRATGRICNGFVYYKTN